MLDFMIIGLPRSGTTWAANWLTTSDIFCLHDPLYKVHYSEWNSDRVHFPHPMDIEQVGVSCTGIWRWPDFVNAHPARKIVVTRDVDEVNAGLDEIGLPHLEPDADSLLNQINAPHVPFENLFNPITAKIIWEHLLGEGGFCPLRHAQLCEFHVQPNFMGLKPDKEVTKRLYNELSSL